MSDAVKPYRPRRPYETVIATYAPDRRDDLTPAARAAIGYRGPWMAHDLIEDGPYKGQRRYQLDILAPGAPRAPLAWAPECDLKGLVGAEGD